MKIKLTFLLLLVYASNMAQRNAIEEEINESVWKPFLQASSQFDGPAFMQLQSKDFIRVSIDQKVIHGYQQYETGILPNFKRLKEEGKIKRNTEMRFISRIVSAELAYESGYFKSTTSLANGEVRTRYSRFTVILRKESGNWKILVDADSNDGNTITEALYQQAEPLQ